MRPRSARSAPSFLFPVWAEMEIWPWRAQRLDKDRIKKWRGQTCATCNWHGCHGKNEIFSARFPDSLSGIGGFIFFKFAHHRMARGASRCIPALQIRILHPKYQAFSGVQRALGLVLMKPMRTRPHGQALELDCTI